MKNWRYYFWRCFVSKRKAAARTRRKKSGIVERKARDSAPTVVIVADADRSPEETA